MGNPHHRFPRETLERCAMRTQQRGDPMLGTAFPEARVLLVEQPGPWGPLGLAESRFDSVLAHALDERARNSGVRVQVIRRPGRTPLGARRSWAFADCRRGHESLSWGTFDADHELLDLPLDAAAGAPDVEPLYLVCAHSKRDTCCALRGRPLAAALSAVRPGRVWECSHLGGHRFAANVLLLPAGLLYGQVLPLAAAEFVAAAESGEVLGALLRGQLGLPPTAQAALAFAHEHLALRERSALQVESSAPIVDGQGEVRIRGPHGVVDVIVRVETVLAAQLSCADPRPREYLSYRPMSVTLVEDPR